MRHSKRNFWGKMTAAVLAVSMVFGGSCMTALADVELISPNTMMVSPAQGQGPVSGSGPVQGNSPAGTAGYGQVVSPAGTGLNTGVTIGQVSPAAGQSGTNGSSSDKNDVITAGSGKKGAGVITGALITTEGERGNSTSADSILGGASLTMIGSSTGSQMLSMILQTKNGKLIVIDGGFDADADRLRSELKARGGRVAAWLVTHPHKDHVGALNKLLQENANGITIDGIYCSLASPEWYAVYDPSGAEMAQTFISTLSKYPQNKVHYVNKGQTWQVDDVTIQVLNDRYELTNADNHYTGNNASMIYMLTVNGRKILILGDMCYEGGEKLLAEVGAPGLKADIVQMAHHGQNGVSEQVYQAIQPSICLWPTPTWLWNGDESQYATQTTKRWMLALGAQKHYVMKDGNQTIR